MGETLPSDFGSSVDEDSVERSSSMAEESCRLLAAIEARKWRERIDGSEYLRIWSEVLMEE